MPVIQQPGIWDYLGQAFGQTAGTIQDKRKEDKERMRMKVNQIAQMVQSGQMDPEVANKDPDVAAMGFKFAATPQSTARKIMASPQGMPTQIPDLSKFIAPTGIGSTPTPIGMTTANKPWSAEERYFANMPSEAAIKTDTVAGKIADIKLKLSQGQSVSPTDAALAGVKTGSDLELERQAKLDPVLKDAATRHVDTAINTAGLDTSNAQVLRRQAATLAKSAYDNYVRESEGPGSIMKLSPEDKAYAKSFFDAAVRDQVKQAEEVANRLKLANVGRGDARAAAIYSDLITTSKSLIQDAQKRVADSPLGSFIMSASAEQLAKNPEWVAFRQEIEGIYQQASDYRRLAADALLGKGVDVKAIQGLETGGTSRQSAPVTTKGTTPTPPGQTINLEAVKQRILAGQATLADVKKYLLDADLITQEQYNMLAAALKKKKGT